MEGREEVLVSETAAPLLTGGTEDSGLKVLEGTASVWRGKESSVNSMKLNYKKTNKNKALMCASVCGFFFGLTVADSQGVMKSLSSGT